MGLTNTQGGRIQGGCGLKRKIIGSVTGRSSLRRILGLDGRLVQVCIFALCPPVLYSHTHFIVPGIFVAVEACRVVLFSIIIILQRLFKLLIVNLLYQMEQTLNVLIKHKKIQMPIIDFYEFKEKNISIDKLNLLSIT